MTETLSVRRIATALLCLVPLAACNGGAAEEEAEHPSEVVTQWNGGTELFLEYPHPVAGKKVGNWAIHLTDMKDFKAITSGTLVVRFVKDGRVAEQFTLPKPARNGIFILDPLVREPGTYQVQLALRSPRVTSTHTLPEVRVWADAGQLPKQPVEEAGGGISFLKEQQWVIDFAVEPATEREVARAVSAAAEIVPADGAQVQVSSPSSGIAMAEANRGAPSVGTRVRAGQVLAVLSPTSEEGGYARIRENIERLQREAARAQRLFAAGAIPAKRLEETRHELAVARAEARAMGGGPDADYRYRVRAPISGFVTERGFIPGGRVEAGAPLFTIVDPSTVWLKANLPAAAASALPRDAKPTFTVEGDSRSYTAARLVSVGSAVDPQTRTVPAVFAVANPDGVLKTGQFARASIPAGGSVRGVAIPTRAIVDDGGIPVAYVQISGETFERRRLRVGESDGTMTEVVEGIKPGEMVVTTGAYQVRLASMSNTPMSGGHAH
ncbi:MAG TPA: efflux RND transporter periplasmic adaptor subunit [Longimicrobium sp.]|nr:efflux RND transporter periplasmic adaptor subunit [Longimicrobium sp.]